MISDKTVDRTVTFVKWLFFFFLFAALALVVYVVFLDSFGRVSYSLLTGQGSTII